MSTTFVYLVEGEPHVGTVSDYAKAAEAAHYAGLDLCGVVFTFLPNPHSPGGAYVERTTPKITQGPYSDDDYATLVVELEFVKGDPEVATVRIDGRA